MKSKLKLRNYKAHSEIWNMRQMLMPYEYREKFYTIVDHMNNAESIEDVFAAMIDHELERIEKRQ